jgi:hypothetical protein
VLNNFIGSNTHKYLLSVNISGRDSDSEEIKSKFLK